MRCDRITATEGCEGAGILCELQIVDQLVCAEDRIGGNGTERAADVNVLLSIVLVFHSDYFLSDKRFNWFGRHKNSRVHTKGEHTAINHTSCAYGYS